MAEHACETQKREFTVRGCILTMLYFISIMIWEGVYKSLGVLLPTLRDQFTTHTWIIGIVTSLLGSASAASGILAGPIARKLGSRRSVIACTLLLNCGLILVSVAPNAIFMAIPATILVGFSVGIFDVIMLGMLGRHFSRHFSMACGMGHSGGAISLFIFAPLTQLFLDTYGWRGAMVLITAICCHSIPCAMLITNDKAAYDSVPDRDISEQANTNPQSSMKAFLVGVCQRAGMAVLLESKYWLIVFSRLAVTFSNSSWLIYYVPHLEDKGISSEVAASLCSAAAVGYFLGTFIWSPFIDRGYVRCTTALIVSSLMLAVSFIVDPWVTSVLGYVFVTFQCGLFIAAMFTLNDILVKEVFGAEELPNAYAWLRLAVVVVLLLSGFLPGWLYDATGSYDMAFIIIGCVPCAALIPLVIGLVLKKI